MATLMQKLVRCINYGRYFWPKIDSGFVSPVTMALFRKTVSVLIDYGKMGNGGK